MSITPWKQAARGRWERSVNGRRCSVVQGRRFEAFTEGPGGKLRHSGFYATETGAKRMATLRTKTRRPAIYEVTTDEGKWTGDLEDFFPEGDHPPEALELVVGRSYYGGGGAAPSFKVKRIR